MHLHQKVKVCNIMIYAHLTACAYTYLVNIPQPMLYHIYTLVFSFNLKYKSGMAMYICQMHTHTEPITLIFDHQRSSYS